MPYEVPNDVIMYHEKRIEWNILISACMPYCLIIIIIIIIYIDHGGQGNALSETSSRASLQMDKRVRVESRDEYIMHDRQ